MNDVVLRGDKQCPHGHTARRKCQDCEREDDQKEIERLRDDLTTCQLERDRYKGALETLLPGLTIDLRYADANDDIDALRSRVETVTEALRLPPPQECNHEKP